MLAQACATVPGAVLSPFGVGVEEHTGEICKGIIETVKEVTDTSLEAVRASQEYETQLETKADCKGNNAAFARIWCDIFCVKSAVQDGNRAILESLQMAVSVLETNIGRLLDSWLSEAKVRLSLTKHSRQTRDPAKSVVFAVRICSSTVQQTRQTSLGPGRSATRTCSKEYVHVRTQQRQSNIKPSCVVALDPYGGRTASPRSTTPI